MYYKIYFYFYFTISQTHHYSSSNSIYNTLDIRSLIIRCFNPLTTISTYNLLLPVFQISIYLLFSTQLQSYGYYMGSHNVPIHSRNLRNKRTYLTSLRHHNRPFKLFFFISFILSGKFNFTFLNLNFTFCFPRMAANSLPTSRGPSLSSALALSLDRPAGMDLRW